MHNSVSRKSSLLYIFKPNISQRLFTLPRSLPSLSFYTFPLHSPSLSAIMLPRSPPPSISLPHPFRSVTIASTLVLFRTLFEPSPYPPPLITGTLLYRYCFVLHLFCGKWMFIIRGSRITKIFNFFHLFYGYDAGLDFV